MFKPGQKALYISLEYQGFNSDFQWDHVLDPRQLNWIMGCCFEEIFTKRSHIRNLIIGQFFYSERDPDVFINLGILGFTITLLKNWLFLMGTDSFS